ncbi:MAG: ankyrin repeat domain-containing protein [Bryobacterales bacterium]|nr:ankyrin repeat domain-containing protein [Bryobacterales bacterium]
MTTQWLLAVYGHDGNAPQPALAARILADNAGLIQNDLYLACAAGALDIIRHAIHADPACVHGIAGQWSCPVCGKPLAFTPLTAVTHSALIQLPEFRQRLLDSARLLLDAGADVNQPWIDGPHSLSPLYGAAGRNHNAEMTKLLLDAGANPNDGESLYHSMEAHSLECARHLLDAGAKVEGSNALHHCLDRDDLPRLQWLRAPPTAEHDSTSPLGPPLLWAIRRARSRAHIEALLTAGASPNALTKEGLTAAKFAQLAGLTEISALLAQSGTTEPFTTEETFVAACARCDEHEAGSILQQHPGIFQQLSEAQLRQLPNLIEAGKKDAARLMVRLGWPIAVRGGDWKASALNLAVYQGDAALTRFLLEHGASWTETQGFGGNVHGTLCWASRNMPPTRDYIGCAKALIDHGLPILELEGDYSPQLADFIASERRRLSP